MIHLVIAIAALIVFELLCLAEDRAHGRPYLVRTAATRFAVAAATVAVLHMVLS